MKNIKRILSFVICIGLILQLSALAVPAGAVGDFRYTIKNGEVTITDFLVNQTHMVIPDTIEGYPVTAIGDSDDPTIIMSEVEQITLPSTLNYIGSFAFQHFINLKTIVIPAGVTEIKDHSFGHCEKLESIVFLGEITSVEDFAFYSCKELKSISFSNSLKTIGESAFTACYKLKSITGTTAVQQVGKDAFASCKVLKKIDLTSAVSVGDEAFRGCAALTEVSFGDKLESIGESAFSSCEALPKIDLKSAVSVGSGAFNGCISLTRVVYGDKLESIADETFLSCGSLSEIDLKNVVSIGEKAFYGCNALTELTFGNKLESVGKQAFAFCKGLTRVSLQGNGAELGTCAFSDCPKLKTVVLGNGVSKVGWGCFENCKELNDVQAAQTAMYLASNSFKSTAFYDKDSNWENGLLYVGKNLLSAKKDITGEIQVKEGTLTISDDTFYLCTAMTSLDIPDSVVIIGEGIIEGCNSLKTLFLGKGVSDLSSNLQIALNGLEYIEVAEDNGYYSDQDGILFDKAGTKLVRFPCKRGGEYIIPQGVTTIGEYAFGNAKELEKVVMPDSVTILGEKAFYDCNASTIILSDNIKEIPAYAFYSCDIVNIELPLQLESIGERAFFGCTALERIELPEKVTSLAKKAFGWCLGLKEVVLNEGLETIGESCFYAEVQYIYLPDSVTTVGKNAFIGCSKMTALRIGPNVTSMDSSDGYYYDSLRCIYYAGTQENLKEVRGWFYLINSGATIHYESEPSFIETTYACGHTKTFCGICKKELYATGDHIPNGNWVVLRPSTVSVMGIKAQHCKLCGQVAKTEMMKLLPDVYQIFQDVRVEDWFIRNGSIRYVYYNNLFQGTSSTTFSPKASMTRGMFVTVLGRLHGVASTKKTTKFTDVKQNAYYSGYVKWASDNKIVTGTSSKTFSPEDNITREQICTIMMRYCNYAKISLQQPNQAVLFEDASQISGYAKKAVGLCQRAGVVNGERTDTGYRFRPQGYASRAEVATIIMNFSRNYIKK